MYLINKPLSEKSEIELYVEMLENYRQQIQFLLDQMPILNKIVFNSNYPSKSYPFSSGQDIKPVSFMKYNYFKLLYSSMVVIQQKDPKTLE